MFRNELRRFSIFFAGKIVAIILFCPRLIAFWKLGTESVMMTFVNLMMYNIYQQNFIFDAVEECRSFRYRVVSLTSSSLTY